MLVTNGTEYTDEYRQERTQLNSEYQKWRDTCREFNIKLAIYFPQNKDITSGWKRLCDSVHEFYVFTTVWKEHDLVEMIGNATVAENEKLIGKIIDSDMAGFKHGLFQ